MEPPELPQVTESNRRTSRPAIEAFMQRFDLVLPGSYIKFLMETNGGRPVEPTFPVSGSQSSSLESVHFFFGLAPDYEGYDLTGKMSFFENKIPRNVVPIASTDTGDYICLDIKNQGERVVFWNQAYFWSTGEWRESDLYFIAGSFEEFLKLLRPNPF